MRENIWKARSQTKEPEVKRAGGSYKTQPEKKILVENRRGGVSENHASSRKTS
jgi:hypothetical protein